MATRFGDYRLLRRIAAGGMGEVFLAVLERGGGFHKPVALKTMLPGCCRRPGFSERFESEAAIAAMLNHANIVQIFDHGYLQERAYLAMELVEGPDLATLLAGGRRLQPSLVAEIGVQVCRGLAHAHERRDLSGRTRAVVHGDVSPGNILVSREGQVKLADFGIACLLDQESSPGLITGKFSYMSPEQARGEPPRPASDLYSLGLVLAEALCGHKLLAECDSTELALEQARRGVTDPGSVLPEGLRASWGAILSRALHPEAGRRFASAAEMCREIAATCSPGGPEGLAELVTASSGGTASLRPYEATEAAINPLAEAPPPARWRYGLLGLFVLFWASAGLWWWLHPRPGAVPPPPRRDTPRAPGGLAVRPLTAATAATGREGPHTASPVVVRRHIRRRPGKTPQPRQPSAVDSTQPAAGAPPARTPLLQVEPAPGWSLAVDHRPLTAAGPARLGERRHYLIELHPQDAVRPAIAVRLIPSPGRSGSWKLAVRARPWMNLAINGRPAGQTPRAGLLLHPGRHRLTLERDGTRVSLRLHIRGRS
ncbi:MAG: hypothetical protein DRI34_08250 [Deltaproteobacteria bacterium]|nr:MAG: hypothetical protein DRI34_08250 [Deltaproteobacteria bacterium]